MMKTAGYVLIVFAMGAISVAKILSDDVATAALWHMDTVTEKDAVAPDDDSMNPGRDRDLTLTYPGTNETPPSLVEGYEGNAMLFDGTNIAYGSDFWSSSNTELKLDCMLYITALPSELGADVTYLFSTPSTSSPASATSDLVFNLGNWPSTVSGEIRDYMRFKVVLKSGSITADLPVYDLKNQWLHIVCSYSSSKVLDFSITDASGTVRSVTATGSYALVTKASGIRFGYTVGKPASRGFRGMIDEVKFSSLLTVPHYSYSPNPANGAMVIELPETLGWSKGIVADASDIYFGSSSTAVANTHKLEGDINGDRSADWGDFSFLAATWENSPTYPCADLDFSGMVDTADLAFLIDNWLADSDPMFVGSTPQMTIAMPELDASTTYYWRAASANCSELDAGSVWTFTTGSAQATSPSPTNTATNVAVADNIVSLVWAAGFGAGEFNVYFGTGSSPSFYANTSSTSIDSPSLLPNTTYYWRVDSVRSTGTTTGTVWHFTTGPIGSTSPSPANGETDVTYFMGGVQLAWDSIYEAESYDVYFGATNPPTYIGTVTEPAISTPDVTSNTMYYWRVDCVGSLGNVTGSVWQFTTSTPAFPTAQGFGRFAKGGRGGTVYHVTTLADSGTGSLRDAVSVANRTIVFDVGGQITLSSRLGITVNNLTIAGQTAPGDGISIAGPGISIGADDLIIRYIRVRYTNSGTQDDAFSLNSSCDNVIIDHISTSWGTDEVFSITSSRYVTAQWCIIAESQNCLGHSKGSLLEWPQLTMHHCLYVHNNDRNPKNKGVFDFRNNVVYDWGFAPYIAGGGSGGLSYANCVGNYYIAGASTTTEDDIMVIGGNLNYSIYLADNRIDSNRNGLVDGLDLGTAIVRPSEPVVLMGEPFAYPPVETDSPETAYLDVLNYVGCSLVRDSIDTRIINEVITQTGGIIYSYEDVGGLGTITGSTAPIDTDQDGMPDAWETAHGLSINNAADGNYDPDGDGYTNLEVYLNSLVPNL